MILNPQERNAFYNIPTLNDIERIDYFSCNDIEVKALYSFKAMDAAIYFAICLAIFKVHYTLINFHTVMLLKSNNMSRSDIL